MRMTIAAIHLQLFQDTRTEAIVRDHTLDSVHEDPLGIRLHQFFHRLDNRAAGVSRMMEIRLKFRAPSFHLDPVGVDDDNKISAVRVGREDRLMLSAQDVRDVTRHATERLSIGVDQIPFLRNLILIERVRNVLS